MEEVEEESFASDDETSKEDEVTAGGAIEVNSVFEEHVAGLSESFIKSYGIYRSLIELADLKLERSGEFFLLIIE